VVVEVVVVAVVVVAVVVEPGTDVVMVVMGVVTANFAKVVEWMTSDTLM